MSIKITCKIGRTDDSLAVWRHSGRRADVPGKWVIVDGEFLELDEAASARRLVAFQIRRDGSPDARV
jgi:hypothetical protein